MVSDSLPEKSSIAPNGHIQEQNARPKINVKTIKEINENANNEIAGDAK
jgi:hypothetical protein